MRKLRIVLCTEDDEVLAVTHADVYPDPQRPLGRTGHLMAIAYELEDAARIILARERAEVEAGEDL